MLGGDGRMTQVALGQFASNVGNNLFVGRESTCQLLDDFVASVSGGAAAGVVAGEAGIGKTALLHSLERRSEAPVRWLRGMEAEAVLPFAAAADLLTPLQPYFPNPQAFRQFEFQPHSSRRICPSPFPARR